MGVLLDVATFGATRAAGDIARGEGEVAAQQEEVAAVAREADRKSRLASALASQNAAAGAKGIAAFEGSPLTIIDQDIKAEERATKRDLTMTRLRAITARARGRIAQKQARTQATIGLIRAGEQKAQAAVTAGAGG